MVTGSSKLGAGRIDKLGGDSDGEEAFVAVEVVGDGAREFEEV